MVGLVFGTFLLAPTALTLGVLVAAWTAFSVQIPLEEKRPTGGPSHASSGGGEHATS